MDTVYDTSVVAYSNGELAGRRRGNALDRRLALLEAFIEGHRVAWYNGKLLQEYEKIKDRRNDVVEAFLIRLADHGRGTRRSTLARQDNAKARRIRWPSHDQHLLAAALEGTETTIFVTEPVLANCSTGAWREFRVHVKAT